MLDDCSRSWRRGGRLTLVLRLGLAVLVAPAAYGGTVIHVDDDADPGGDGLSWETAYRFLQDALAAGPNATEIRVASGTYLPDQSEANPTGTGERPAKFQLVSGLALRGGYAGIGAGDPNERDITLYETVLSGDLLGDDGPDFANNAENSLSVVSGNGVDNSAILDGFTIRGGNADEIHGVDHGGGLNNDNGSPTVRTCTFEANSAISGGGMFNFFASPVVSHCRFIGNRADAGGGLYNLLASGSFIGCLFQENTAIEGAGVISFDSIGVVELINCGLIRNAASSKGGGAHVAAGDAVMTCCTISGNSAPSGSGVSAFRGDVVLTNSIVWENPAVDGVQILAESVSSLTVSYCDIEEAEFAIQVDDTSSMAWLEGNIDVEPGFADAGSGDYRLMSGSPCIDAADNTALAPEVVQDMDGNPRFVDDPDASDTGHGDCPIVDMGAHERQDGTTDCCPADVDGNGAVEFGDILLILGAWGPCGDCPEDIDGNGAVEFADLLLLLGAWGPCDRG